MTDELRGQSILFLLENSGVEQVELTGPWQAVTEAGGVPQLIAPKPGSVQAFNQDVEKGDRFPVDAPVEAVQEQDFDGLVLPGGTTNADRLRLDAAAVRLVRAFVEARKPIAAICHGPWALVEADVLRGKTLTSFPSLRTDIVNAGGDWRDEEVVVCSAQGWTLVTSRQPDDLPAFTGEIVTSFATAS